MRTPYGVKLYVDVYPVGVLFSRNWKGHMKDIFRHMTHGEWRQLKNMFNGYLAEPDLFPGKLTRCGSGWTRKRALRDLQRRVNRS